MIFDSIIIGAGIAGASVAQALAPHQRVLILEREAFPGYHTTGRSNAFWHATYGGPAVAPLTLASRATLETPPAALSDHGFLKARGALTLARADQDGALLAMEAAYTGNEIAFERVGREALEGMIPGLKPGWDHALVEPECFDIDVAGYHAACLGSARRQGAQLVTRAEPLAISRDNGLWTIETRQGRYSGAVLVNAAGAWADPVAEQAGARPIGIQPYRRTIAQLDLTTPIPPDMPFVIDVAGQFYFRPEGPTKLWLSPHDETPSPPCDAAPEELDIAIAIDRLSHVTDWGVRRVERSWAGLRSFAPDRKPVFGFDPACEGLFWCAGQGGFGIQTAPAAAALCASLILGDRRLCPAGVKAEDYAPSRTR